MGKWGNFSPCSSLGFSKVPLRQPGHRRWRHVHRRCGCGPAAPFEFAYHGFGYIYGHVHSSAGPTHSTHGPTHGPTINSSTAVSTVPGGYLSRERYGVHILICMPESLDLCLTFDWIFSRHHARTQQPRPRAASGGMPVITAGRLCK